MDAKPKQVERYGKQVWEDSEMDALRRKRCLCLRCAKMKPENGHPCPMAGDLYAICLRDSLALMVTRCPSWEPRRPE